MGGGSGYADGDPINLSDPTGKFATPNDIGKAGERAAEDLFGAAKSEERVIVNGVTRIPDFILREAKTGDVWLVAEVKNVAYLYGSRAYNQIRDELLYAAEHNAKFVLLVRNLSKVSRRIRDLVRSNGGTIGRIPTNSPGDEPPVNDPVFFP